MQACYAAPMQGGVVAGSDVGRALRAALEPGLVAVGSSVRSVGVSSASVLVDVPGSSWSAPSVLTSYTLVEVS